MEGCYGEEGKEGESGEKDETPEEEVEFKGYAAPRGPGESRGLLPLWTWFTSLRRFGSRDCCAGTGINSAYRIPMMSVLGWMQASLE